MTGRTEWTTFGTRGDALFHEEGDRPYEGDADTSWGYSSAHLPFLKQCERTKAEERRAVNITIVTLFALWNSLSFTGAPLPITGLSRTFGWLTRSPGADTERDNASNLDAPSQVQAKVQPDQPTLAVSDEGYLNWDVWIDPPPSSEAGFITVKLEYLETGNPLAVEDPSA
jgi:hypothetical protein